MQAQADNNDVGRGITQFHSGQHFFIVFGVDLIEPWKGRLVYSCEAYDVTSGSPVLMGKPCAGAEKIDLGDRRDIQHNPVFDATIKEPAGRTARFLVRGHVTMEGANGATIGEAQERTTVVTILPP
jgi:hypothetical protein